MTEPRDVGENGGVSPSNPQGPTGERTSPARPSIDPERLAALLDGTLGAAERAALLTALDADPEQRAAYADALAVLDEIEDERTVRSRSSGTRLLRPRSLATAVIALAAGVLIVVGVRTKFGTGHGSAIGDATSVMAELGPIATLPAGWQPARWSQPRGEPELSERARSVRIGAAVTDLMLLARQPAAGDSARATARGLAVLLRPLPAGNVLADNLIAAAERSAADAVHQAVEVANVQPRQSAVRAGSGLEGARVAAARRDTAFFRRALRDGALDEIGALLQGDDPAPLAAVHALARTRPIEWPALGEALDTLLAQLGR